MGNVESYALALTLLDLGEDSGCCLISEGNGWHSTLLLYSQSFGLEVCSLKRLVSRMGCAEPRVSYGNQKTIWITRDSLRVDPRGGGGIASLNPKPYTRHPLNAIRMHAAILAQGSDPTSTPKLLCLALHSPSASTVLLAMLGVSENRVQYPFWGVPLLRNIEF